MDPSDELRRRGLEEQCPLCGEKFTNIEEHVNQYHAGGFDVGFLKSAMRIDKDLEKLKRIEQSRAGLGSRV